LLASGRQLLAICISSSNCSITKNANSPSEPVTTKAVASGLILQAVISFEKKFYLYYFQTLKIN